MTRITGRISQRSIGPAYRAIASKSPVAIGISAGWTRTGQSQAAASSRAEPEWSGWTWVSRMHEGTVSGPSTVRTADRMRSASCAQPASTSTHEEPARTR